MFEVTESALVGGRIPGRSYSRDLLLEPEFSVTQDFAKTAAFQERLAPEELSLENPQTPEAWTPSMQIYRQIEISIARGYLRFNEWMPPGSNLRPQDVAKPSQDHRNHISPIQAVVFMSRPRDVTKVRRHATSTRLLQFSRMLEFRPKPRVFFLRTIIP